MSKSIAWMLPPVAIVLALALAGTAAWLWLGGPAGGAGGGPGLGKWVATAQAARADARGAIAGDAAAFDRLAASRSELAKQRAAAGSAQGAERTFAAAGGWATLDASLAAVGGTREALLDMHAARERLLQLGPQLLAATGNLVSALPAADLAADRPYLDRFELAVESVRQNVRALATGTDIDESVQRLNDAGQYLSQIIRGLRGEDTTLGMTPVRGQAAQANLDSATRLFEDARTAIGTIVAGAGQLAAAETAAASIDKEAGALLADYRRLDLGAAGAGADLGNTPLVLFAIAALLVVVMVMILYQARGSRRAADNQTEQNERNQQAILRLLDELSSLADGDLTVQATVTEDITGAIADS